MISSRNQPINILLAEDNPGDVFLIKSILKESNFPYDLHHVLNGEDIMTFLNQNGESGDLERPDLILLDLNLPLKHGLEVLAEIKSNPKLRMVPVIILTSSSAEQDMIQSYNLYASCYVNKPVDLNDFIAALKSLENFWLQFVRFPSRLEPQNI